MKRYIALLRGINVSGKNKISMSELKKEFTEPVHFLVTFFVTKKSNLISESSLGNDDFDLVIRLKLR